MYIYRGMHLNAKENATLAVKSTFRVEAPAPVKKFEDLEDVYLTD